MIDISKAPVIYKAQGTTVSDFGSMDALKDVQISFNGYGIAEGETIQFPTLEEYNANFKQMVRKTSRTTGNNNTSVGCLVLVLRDGREGWFNMGTVTRQANDQNGERKEIDDFHQMMREEYLELKSRLEFLAGKTIKGTNTINAWGPKFENGIRVPGEFVERKYVQIELVEEKPAKK